MPRAWRLFKARYRSEALSGEGAALFGGRWNSPGIRAVYAADSLALAALELLVKIGRPDRRTGFLALPIEIADAPVATLESSRLPPGWRSSPPPAGTQALGDAWLRSGSSLAMRVPSAVVPEEFIYVLNPGHPEFPKLRAGKGRPFEFDPRLLG